MILIENPKTLNLNPKLYTPQPHRLFKLLHLRHFFGKGPGRVSETSGGFLVTSFKIMLQLYVPFRALGLGFGVEFRV